MVPSLVKTLLTFLIEVVKQLCCKHRVFNIWNTVGELPLY